MALFTVSRNLVVQASQPLATWIAQALAPLVIPSIQKEIQAMSATIAEAVANLEAVAQRAVAEVQALQAQHSADQATIADLTAKLSAAQAGDPAEVAAIDNVTESLNAVAPAPQPAPEPDPNQPQG